jgi:hypothetical protein
VGVADADQASAEHDDRHALEHEQPTERDDERRHLEAGNQRSLNQPDRRADQQCDDDRKPPWPVQAGGLHLLGDEDRAQSHDQTHGEVDLAEEQGEDLRHREQHVDGALLEEVDQVLR